MTNTYLIAMIAVASVCTFATRLFPFALFGGSKEVPKFIKYLGGILPVAIIGALIIYCLRDFIKGDINIDRKFRIYNRSVAMCDKNDNIIRIFKSSSEASKVTNIPSTNITRCCKGERKTAGGLIWKYADEIENNTLETI